MVKEAGPGRPLRIGVIGLGRIGRRHAQLIHAHRLTELAGVADPSTEAREYAREAGFDLFETADGLLANARPDGVVVATPNAMHLEHALLCIDAGIPLLLEKPIATIAADGSAIADAGRRTGVPVLVGHHRRHSPILAAARDVIRAGALGEIVAIVGTALFFKPDEYFAAAPWRSQPGGGPILINLVHDIDALRWLCGDIVAVQGMASDRVRSFPVEDTAALALRFASGALGTFLLSDAAAAPTSWEGTSGEDPMYAAYPGHDAYQVAGTRGWLGVPSLRLMSSAGSPSWTRSLATRLVPAERGDPLIRQLEHFCAVTRRQADPLVTAGDAVETLRVTLAVAEAVNLRAEVECAPAPAKLS